MALKVKELASMLGVSSSTVSLVLNNRPGISEATRQRIFDKLTELGYSDMIPKAAAASSPNLRLVIFKKHGSVVRDTHFFSQVIEGIDIQTRKNGYNLLITGWIAQRNSCVLSPNPPVTALFCLPPR